jgi:hypothetical protein
MYVASAASLTIQHTIFIVFRYIQTNLWFFATMHLSINLHNTSISHSLATHRESESIKNLLQRVALRKSINEGRTVAWWAGQR